MQRLYIWAILLFSVLYLGACSSKKKIEIKVKGDDVGAFVFDDFFQNYNQRSQKYHFTYLRGGAQTGLFALADKTAQMVFSLKKLNNEDIIRLKSAKIYPYKEAILRVPIVVISGSGIPLEKISEKQLKPVFSGDYKYWWKLREWKNRRELIPFGAIEVCAPDRRNGEFYFFRDKINIVDFSLDARIFNHNKAVLDYVSKNPSAIGFLSLPFFKQNKNVQVLYSSPDMEATGYLIMSRDLLKEQEIIDFLGSLRVYLNAANRKSVLLQNGIRVISSDAEE